MRVALVGDGDSPHLLKWARALAPRVELWAASSRGFLPGFDGLLPPQRRLALHTHPAAAGGNIGLLVEGVSVHAKPAAQAHTGSVAPEFATAL